MTNSYPFVKKLGIFYIFTLSIFSVTVAQKDTIGESFKRKFFCLDKDENTHFLIDLDGNPYRSLGINHFHNMTSKNYDSVVRHIKSLGFNAGGYQAPKWIWKRYPHTKGINMLKTSVYRKGDKFEYEDVFDPSFLIVLEERISEVVKPMATNANLIGYFWTDLPIWHRKKNGGWVDFYKTLDSNSNGHQMFLEWKRKNPEADEDLFTVEIAKKVYAEGYRILRKYDSNHLIFGDRFHQADMPVSIVKEIIPYIDALAIQPTEDFDKGFYDALFTKYGKPIYIADHVTSFATVQHPVTMGQVAKSENEYGAYYKSTITNFFSLPYLIGFNKCQYQDDVRPNLLKQGIIKADGKPYDIQSTIKKANFSAMKLFKNMVENDDNDKK